jgi:hypothetical protein
MKMKKEKMANLEGFLGGIWGGKLTKKMAENWKEKMARKQFEL